MQIYVCIMVVDMGWFRQRTPPCIAYLLLLYSIRKPVLRGCLKTRPAFLLSFSFRL